MSTFRSFEELAASFAAKKRKKKVVVREVVSPPPPPPPPSVLQRAQKMAKETQILALTGKETGLRSEDVRRIAKEMESLA